MEKQKFTFTNTGEHPYAAATSHHKNIEGLNLEVNLSSLAIFPVAVGGKQINSILEIPTADVPAFIQAITNAYNEYAKENQNVPALPVQPKTTLSLRIRYEHPNKEYNEERLFPDTPEGLENARRQAVNINNPQEYGTVPDIFAETVELWRWSENNDHYVPEHLETWSHEWPEVKIEVGKQYLRRDGTIVTIEGCYDKWRKFPYWANITDEGMNRYDEHGHSLFSEEDECNLLAEYIEGTPFTSIFTHTIH